MSPIQPVQSVAPQSACTVRGARLRGLGDRGKGMIGASGSGFKLGACSSSRWPALPIAKPRRRPNRPSMPPLQKPSLLLYSDECVNNNYQMVMSCGKTGFGLSAKFPCQSAAAPGLRAEIRCRPTCPNRSQGTETQTIFDAERALFGRQNAFFPWRQGKRPSRPGRGADPLKSPRPSG